jgi:hypothetical protein
MPVDDRSGVDAQAVRIHVVLSSAQGLTVEEIHAGLRARHYVTTRQDVVDALARHPSQFSSEQGTGIARWRALNAHFPVSMPSLGCRPNLTGWSRRPSGLGWGLTLDSVPDKGSPAAVIEMINVARRRRGDAVLDSREAAQVAANLQKRAADPSHYRNVCWNCNAVVDEGTNEHCSECRWLVCWCGACRHRTYEDKQGFIGPCRREVWTLVRDDIPDFDYRGRPILTARPPGSDANSIRRLTHQAGIAAIYHWSPSRAVLNILRWGLLARPELRGRGVVFVPHSYGSAEKEQALAGYVATSLRPKLNMMATWSEAPVIWELDPEVLSTDGALFVDGNAASASLALEGILASRGSGHLRRVLDAYLEPGGQPEMLIPGRIPRAAIAHIRVLDEYTASTVRSHLKSMGSPMDGRVTVS